MLSFAYEKIKWKDLIKTFTKNNFEEYHNFRTYNPKDYILRNKPANEIRFYKKNDNHAYT